MLIKFGGTVIAAFFLFGASACSTMSTIRSDPPGAKVYMQGRYLGSTPVQVELKDGFIEGSDYFIKVQKEGYKTQEFKLAQRFSVGYIVLDALLCLPTLGLGCNLAYLNGQTHLSEYPVLLEPDGNKAPQAAQRVPAESNPPPDKINAK
jgi:hypothetical protein